MALFQKDWTEMCLKSLTCILYSTVYHWFFCIWRCSLQSYLPIFRTQTWCRSKNQTVSRTIQLYMCSCWITVKSTHKFVFYLSLTLHFLLTSYLLTYFRLEKIRENVFRSEELLHKRKTCHNKNTSTLSLNSNKPILPTKTVLKSVELADHVIATSPDRVWQSPLRSFPVC